MIRLRILCFIFHAFGLVEIFPKSDLASNSIVVSVVIQILTSRVFSIDYQLGTLLKLVIARMTSFAQTVGNVFHMNSELDLFPWYFHMVFTSFPHFMYITVFTSEMGSSVACAPFLYW